MKLLILKELLEIIEDIFGRRRKPVAKSKKGKVLTVFPINLQ